MTRHICLSRPAVLAVALAALLALLIGPAAARADDTGHLLYTPTSATEANAYARVIRLAHAGGDDGRLLATFEHWNTDGTPARFVIRASDDDGATWSTLAAVGDPLTGPGHPVSQMWQPSLFEFPHRLGAYPAGTLLLVGNMVPADGSYTQFYSWRSTDHGRTWRPVGGVQRGGTFGKGIWEPFLALDAKGRLVAYFSDERDSPAHSQMLVHVTSTDGGDSWGPVVRDVASSVAGDRPGMPTVTRMGPHGDFVLSYEVCGRPNCEVRYKTSHDGDRWRPTDLGTLASTGDGRYLGHSPYVTWDPSTHALLLAGQRMYSTVGHQPTGEDYRAVLVNTDGGKGAWSWTPAPWTVSPASSACNANYSPNLLVEGDALRYTAPTSVGDTGPCGEATGTAPVPALPFHDRFATAGQAGWIDYGGCWQVNGDTYAVTCGGDEGPKALTGSTGWTDYTVAADVRVTSANGDAGVLARTTNPAVGPDSHAGYTAFVDAGGGTLTVARQQYAYEPLATVPVPGGVRTGTWYRISFTVKGFGLSATLASADGGSLARVSVTDPYRSFPNGLVGLRDHAGTAEFRAVTVTQAVDSWP